MDPTRPSNGDLAPGFPAENRAQSPSTTPAVSSDPGAPVTAGRAGGVVQPSTGQLVYEADSAGHRVVARYPDGQIAFAFGGYGRLPGQFDTPLHVVPICPEFHGEPLDSGIASLVTPWLAVADYGNHRVQFFECDGAWIGESELDPAEPPCQLAWRAPTLDITTLEGRAVRLHVAAALLATTRRDVRHEPRTHSDPRRVWRVC